MKYIEIEYTMIVKEDAAAFWELMNALDSETEFMMLEPGERVKDLGLVEEVIEGARCGQDFLIGAVADGELVGYLLVQRGRPNRIRHSAYVVTGIRKKYCGMGIGTAFFNKLTDWAMEKGVRRLELTVMCRNTRARHLYEKSGFVIEGVKKDSMLVDGTYMDEYYMAKILEEK